VLMSLLGYPLVAVALPHRHPMVNGFFNHQRERTGVQVVPSSGVAIRRVYRALEQNKLVAIVSDRDFVGNGLKMDFLGAEKIMPRGAAVLSVRTGAPMVPGFVIRRPDDTHVLEFLEPLDTRVPEDDIVREGARVIEKIIRKYPDQWLMFREFWKE
jgi:KDO2-lipid IV(A) lauroyltransferase